MTEVELLFYRDRINHWVRFGQPADERIIDRRRRILCFAPGAIFAFVRWEANDHGTVLSRIDVLRAPDRTAPISTIPGVRPGGEILLRLAGWSRVKQTLDRIAAIEAIAIDPADVAPEHWRHVQNRVTAHAPVRPYTREQHAAWLLRRAASGS
jgi:hypothetical protein